METVRTRGPRRKWRKFLGRASGRELLSLPTDLKKGGGGLARAIKYTSLDAIYRVKQQ